MKKTFKLLALTLFVVMSIAVATIGSSAAPLVGDINGDGEVNIRDAAMILQIVTGHDVKPAEPCYHVGKVVIDEAVPVSCTADGKTAGVHCTECGDVLLAQVTIPATGHTEVIITAVPATCTETGLTEGKYCSVCKEDIVKQTKIDALGHSEIILPAVPATCTSKGVTQGSYCSVCKITLIAQETTPMIAHNFADGACSVCGLSTGSEGLSYTLSYDKTYYTVTGMGTCTDENIVIPSTYEGLPVKAISGFGSESQIKSVYIPNSVVTINKNAFYNCTGLTIVNIPESVTEIGYYAFESCTNLSVIIINNPECTIYDNFSTFPSGTLIVSEYGSTAETYAKKHYHSFLTFAEYNSGCKDLEFTLSDDGTHYIVTGIGNCRESNIILPCFYQGLPVTEIGEKAFANLSAITSIELSKTIKTIGNRAFYACADLTEVTISESVKSIGTQIFYKADNLKTVYYNSTYSSSNPIFNNSSIETVIFGGKEVPYSILENNGGIKKVVINSPVISSSAFENCTTLTTVEMGSSVETINHNAFFDCINLSNVKIGNNVNSIGDNAFGGCTALTSIGIPSSVTSIEYGAFDNCTALEAVYISDLAAWCQISFQDGFGRVANPLYYAHNLYLNGELVTELVIPKNITSIKKRAFEKCTSIKSVKLHDNVKSIRDYAFSGCTNLESINIPDSVGTIGNYSFYGCENLASIEIPDSVTTIGDYAFYNCKKLTSLEIPDSIMKIYDGTFSACEALVNIKIPDSVTSIGADAFRYCSSLSEFNFNGTMEEWNAISLGSTWKNGAPFKVVHCTDGDVNV